MVLLRTRRPNKRIWALLAIFGAIALMSGTWVLASMFQSPAQRQAAAEPPPITPVLVEITRGDLVETITMKASASLEGARSIPLPTGENATVVSGIGINAGEEIRPGSIIYWANGHPVFALPGSFPLYRDMSIGDSGQDVWMFQEALAAIGYEIIPDGDFGALTASYIKDLYETKGAVAPTRLPEPKEDAQSGAPKPTEEVYVRMSDFVMLRGLPAQVTSIPAVGSALNDETAKLGLANQSMELRANVPGSVATELAATLPGEAVLDDTKVPLKVASIQTNEEDTPSAETNGNIASDSIVFFTAIEGSFPREWAKAGSILVTINLVEPITDTLLVPERAIATTSQGKDNLLIQQSTESFTEVNVTRLGCVGGICAIEEKDGITAGTQLRVDR